jgi:hypothetical protein
MMKAHKHAEAIKAWADGHTIEVFTESEEWAEIIYPSWQLHLKYRIKREPKPDIVEEALLFLNQCISPNANLDDPSWDRWLKNGDAYRVLAKFKLTYDGEKGFLKHAELAE